MAVAPLQELVRLLSDEGLLDDLLAEDGIVHGRARLDGAGADVAVNIDPELDEVDDPDPGALVQAVARVLAIGEGTWRAVVDAAATEIEDATAEDGEITEQADLRTDMEIRSIVVFADAVLLSFAAERQFPDSRILVQLDEEFEIENVEVVEEDGADTLEFASLDELRDHLRGPAAP